MINFIAKLIRQIKYLYKIRVNLWDVLVHTEKWNVKTLTTII